MIYKEIELNLDWSPKSDVAVDDLPRCAGVYAQIHWPSLGVRVGHAANIRGRHQEARTWLNGMHNGNAKPDQLRRNNVFCQAAKRDGHAGFGHCIISIDPRLADRKLRLELESFAFNWVAQSDQYQDFNYQMGYRNTLQFTTIEEAIAFHQSRVKL